MKATVFPNLILEVISHHSCCILLVTQTDHVQCGRRLPKGMKAEGGAHWGPSGRLATIGEFVPKSSWGSESLHKCTYWGLALVRDLLWGQVYFVKALSEDSDVACLTQINFWEWQKALDSSPIFMA